VLLQVKTRRLLDGIAQGDIAGQATTSDAAPGDCRLHRDFQNAGHLLGWRTSSQ